MAKNEIIYNGGLYTWAICQKKFEIFSFKLKIWISWRNRNFVKKHLKLQYYQDPRAQLEKWGSKILWHTPVKNLKYFDTHS